MATQEIPPIPQGFSTAPPPRAGGGLPPIPPGFSTAPPSRGRAPPRNPRRRASSTADDNGVVEAAGVADAGGPSPVGQYRDSQGEPMSPVLPGDMAPEPGPDTPVNLRWTGTSADPVDIDRLTLEQKMALPVGVYVRFPDGRVEQLAKPITSGSDPMWGGAGAFVPGAAGGYNIGDPSLLDVAEAGVAGLGRGVGKTGATLAELLARANAGQGRGGALDQMVIQGAQDVRSRLDADVQQYRDNPWTEGAMQTGTVGGEVLVTAPVGGLVGRGITAGGNALARVAPGVGNAMARIGQATSAGGFTPRAVRSAGGAAPTFGSAVADLATRATGGAISGGVQTALVDPEQAQAGAAIGAFIPTIASFGGRQAVGAVTDAYDMLRGKVGEARAAQIVRDSLGIDYDAAVAALRAAPENVTARQALVEAGVEPRVFMAVGQAAERGGGEPVFGAIAESQAARRQTTLNRMAGGEAIQPREEVRNAMRGALNQETALPRDTALAQADASASIDVEPIAEHLLGLASARGTRADPVMPSVLATVAQRLRNAAALNDGIIAAEDLYRIRQTVGDDIKEALVTRTGALTDASDRRIGGLLSSVQPLIDDAIEQAGGSGWRQYLADFGSGAQTIERQALMGEAARRLETDGGSFRALVRGDAPDAVGVASGGRTRNINAMLGPGETAGPSRMDALNRFAGELARDERVGQLAADPQAVAEARALLNRSKNPAQQAFGVVARFLSPRGAAAEAFASMLAEQRIGQDVRRALAEGFRNGDSALELLARVPTRERAQVARNMANPAFWSGVQGVGGGMGRSLTEWLNRKPEPQNRMAIGSVGDVPSNALAQ